MELIPGMGDGAAPRDEEMAPGMRNGAPRDEGMEFQGWEMELIPGMEDGAAPVLRRVSHGPCESHPRSMISSLEVQAESAPRRRLMALEVQRSGMFGGSAVELRAG